MNVNGCVKYVEMVDRFIKSCYTPILDEKSSLN